MTSESANQEDNQAGDGCNGVACSPVQALTMDEPRTTSSPILAYALSQTRPAFASPCPSRAASVRSGFGHTGRGGRLDLELTRRAQQPGRAPNYALLLQELPSFFANVDMLKRAPYLVSANRWRMHAVRTGACLREAVSRGALKGDEWDHVEFGKGGASGEGKKRGFRM
ncbi:hypothetical protein CALVIDRAFT_598344 [Calocera viscosa TUFC12733]|uniref:Uncharacterized protein n=1 Tax=Calocera viscosa (strain TUFC12733) TaxID=1330018 RepID=A0A167M6M7_CALVF|nr:hypothetical protein CALVIDRAFT_598344 [Calocera viscosa TUFC12733]